MSDVIKKAMMIGIGLALKTKDEVEDFAKDLITRGEITENDGRKFIDDLQKRYEESRETLEEKIEVIIKDILKKGNIATKDEFLELKKEIRELKTELKEKTDSLK